MRKRPKRQWQHNIKRKKEKDDKVKDVENELGLSSCLAMYGRRCAKRSSAPKDGAKDDVDTGNPNVHTEDGHT